MRSQLPLLVILALTVACGEGEEPERTKASAPPPVVEPPPPEPVDPLALAREAIAASSVARPNRPLSSARMRRRNHPMNRCTAPWMVVIWPTTGPK